MINEVMNRGQKGAVLGHNEEYLSTKTKECIGRLGCDPTESFLYIKNHKIKISGSYNFAGTNKGNVPDHRWALTPISVISDIGLSLISELPISD
jgi:hypothetical protein